MGVPITRGICICKFHVLCSVAWLLITFLLLLEIEIQLCVQIHGRLDLLNVPLEEHYVCSCAISYEIRGIYNFLQGFCPLSKVLEYGYKLCLGLFLLDYNKRAHSSMHAHHRGSACMEGKSMSLKLSF